MAFLYFTILYLNNCAALAYLNLQGVTTNAINGSEIKIENYTGATTIDFTIAGTEFTTFTFINTPQLSEIKFYGEFETINLYGNSILENIDLKQILNLQHLYVQDCNLQSLDVTKNLALKSLVCTNNELTTLDVSNNIALEKFYCNNNKLPRINVTANTALKEFDIANNQLSALNVRNNTALTYLCISNNAELSMVDVKSNPLLKTLYASGLAITDIDLTGNSVLEIISLLNDNLTTITGMPSSIRGIAYQEPTPTQNGLMISTEQVSNSWNNAKTWCSAYGTNWYLPSTDELRVIYNLKDKINFFLSAGGFTPLGTGYYWSSTVYPNNNAYLIYFSNGNTNYLNKDYAYLVRAILAF